MPLNKILIATGGTGGHLLPAQQLGKLLRPTHDVVFAGYKLEESPYFERDLFRFVEIASASLATSRWRLITSLAKGFCQTLRMLWKERPDVVVGFGSYHAAPVLLASALLRKRIVLFEANRKMGKVNRYFLFAARTVGHQFPLVGHEGPKFVPVRPLPWIEKKGEDWTRESARAAYGLDPASFTLLVFGGSQGASFLNQAAPAVLKRLQGAQAIHLAGSECGAQGARALYEKEGIRAYVASYEQEMARAYAAADFALCRSGAGAVTELIRYAVPSLLIPYPYAADHHQRENAQYVCDLGGASMLLQSEASANAMAMAIEGVDTPAMRSALQRAFQEHETSRSFDELVRQLCKKKS